MNTRQLPLEGNEKEVERGKQIKDIQNEILYARTFSIAGFAAAIITILLIIGLMLFANFPRHPHTIAWNQSLASYGFLWQNAAHLLLMGLTLYALGQGGITYYAMIKINVKLFYILFGAQCLAAAWQLGITIWDCWDIRFFTDCASIPQCAVYPAFFDITLIGMFVVFVCVVLNAASLIIIAIVATKLRGVPAYFEKTLNEKFVWKPEWDWIGESIDKYLLTSKKAVLFTATMFDHNTQDDNDDNDDED
jgi:hypothetical protein